MKAAVLHKAQDMRIEQRPVPKPQPNEALVRLRAIGVCGSDIHYYFAGALGKNRVQGPMLVGHECAGEVVEVGAEVEGLKPGDRVVVEPGLPCRVCHYCRTGRYNICKNMRFLGTPPVDGAFCEYLAWPADFLYPMPEGMTFEEGALIEPVAVGVYAVDQAGMRSADSAVVLGSAAIGLFTLQAAVAAGAGPVFATDLCDYRLDVARKLGAAAAFNPRREDVLARVKEATDGEGVDAVFEAAGAPETFLHTIDFARQGATVILIGICQEDVVPMNMGECRRKEVTLKSVRRYRHVFDKCIKLVAKGKIDVRSLITHRYALDDIVEAFETVKECRDEVIKAVIEP